MERLFQILAAILAGVAAFFLWKGDSEAAFVSVVGGVVCFFLGVRFQLKEKLNQREPAAEIVGGQLMENAGYEREIVEEREKETVE